MAYPRMVRRMLISKSTPHPATRKTPMGGTVGVRERRTLGEVEADVLNIVMMIRRIALIILTL